MNDSIAQEHYSIFKKLIAPFLSKNCKRTFEHEHSKPQKGPRPQIDKKRQVAPTPPNYSQSSKRELYESFLFDAAAPPRSTILFRECHEL